MDPVWAIVLVLVPIPTQDYVYRAKLHRMIDGDSQVLSISLGCHVYINRGIRVLGVDTPEVVGVTRAAGLAARDYAVAWYPAALPDVFEWPLMVATKLDRDDKYGRLLATVYRINDGSCLNTDLIASDHAVAYDGGAKA